MPFSRCMFGYRRF